MIGEDPHKFQPMQLAREEIEEMIARGVETAFVRLGIDVSNPFEWQKDFQHLRSWRRATETARSKAILMVFVAVVGGLGIALWAGIKSFVGLIANGPH